MAFFFLSFFLPFKNIRCERALDALKNGFGVGSAVLYFSLLVFFVFLFFWFQVVDLLFFMAVVWWLCDILSVLSLNFVLACWFLDGSGL